MAGYVQKRAYRSRRTGKQLVTWIGRYSGPDGRERSRSFDRKVDAQRFVDANSADVARGQWLDPMAGKVTFKVYAQAWLETKADVSERTFRNVEGRIRNHAVPHFGTMQMSAIRPRDVRAFVSRLSAGRAPETVKSAYLTVSQVSTKPSPTKSSQSPRASRFAYRGSIGETKCTP